MHKVHKAAQQEQGIVGFQERLNLQKEGMQKEGPTSWGQTIDISTLRNETWLQIAFGLTYRKIAEIVTGPVRALSLNNDGTRIAFIPDSRSIRILDQQPDGNWRPALI